MDVDNHIRAAESFSAKDDSEAEEIALATYKKYSTSFHGIELWRGPNVVIRRTRDGARSALDVHELIGKRQESVARLQAMLERSFECVRQSRQRVAPLDQTRAA
jgi:hypothetical protein